MEDFYRTKMGNTFYLSTAPRIARSLESIAKKLEGPQYSEEFIEALITVNQLAMSFMEDSAGLEDPETLMGWKESHSEIKRFINKILKSKE